MGTRLQHCAVAIVLALLALGVGAEPSNKWRIECDNTADNDGVIVLRISPVGGAPIDVETKVPARSGENKVAQLLRDSLRASLGKGYKVEVDDGEDVLIKKKGKTPNFDLTLVSSSVTGLTLEIERE
jgi:hypothetical protein